MVPARAQPSRGGATSTMIEAEARMNPDEASIRLRPTAAEAFAAYTTLTLANRAQVERLRTNVSPQDFWQGRAAGFRPRRSRAGSRWNRRRRCAKYLRRQRRPPVARTLRSWTCTGRPPRMRTRRAPT